MKELNLLIDAELRRRRPDRYNVRGAEDENDDSLTASWLDDVAEAIQEQIPASIAVELLARRLVGLREGSATKRVNKFLRDMDAEGQYALPFEWWTCADEPVAVVTPVFDESTGEQMRLREERVALRAMTSTDWQTFIEHGRQRAQERFDTEMRVYLAAEWLRAEQGGRSFYVWACEELPPAAESA